jgi:PmbA protein
MQALAKDGERTQTGYAGDGARHPGELDLEAVAKRAVSQAVDLIGATKPTTRKVDLVFDQRLASTLLGMIAGTLTGDRINKKRSPFVDRVGEEIASSLLTMTDDPTNPRSLGADTHDGEGLACRKNSLITRGKLDGYLYDAYHGRRAGVPSTGSAVRGTRGLPSPGIQALAVEPGPDGTLQDLIGGVEDGILVFSLAGLHSGVNPVSGDFSVGVEGRAIRGGELAEPLSECTIGSSLQRMLLDIKKLGSDQIFLPSGVSVPSLVVADIMMSGEGS